MTNKELNNYINDTINILKTGIDSDEIKKSLLDKKIRSTHISKILKSAFNELKKEYITKSRELFDEKKSKEQIFAFLSNELKGEALSKTKKSVEKAIIQRTKDNVINASYLSSDYDEIETKYANEFVSAADIKKWISEHLNKSSIKESDIRQIRRDEPIKLASSMAEIQMVLLTISNLLSIGIFSLMIFLISKFEIRHIISMLIFLLFIGIMTYLMFRLRTAKLTGGTLHLWSLFRFNEEFSLFDINYVDSRRFRRRNYLHIEIIKDSKVKKIWVMKPSFFSGVSNPEKILKFAITYHKLLRKKNDKYKG